MLSQDKIRKPHHLMTIRHVHFDMQSNVVRHPKLKRACNFWALSLSVAIPLLASCSSVQPLPAEVRIPVPVPCITTLPERPALISDAELQALDDRKFVIALGLDRLHRMAYQAQLEAVLEGCR